LFHHIPLLLNHRKSSSSSVATMDKLQDLIQMKCSKYVILFFCSHMLFLFHFLLQMGLLFCFPLF
jgi:hypothetical protein